MPIFTAIATAISSTLFAGSLLATKIIAGVLAFGTSLALNYLQRKKTRPYSASGSAVQGQREYGADVFAATMFGTGKVSGHQIYYAKWGAGNKINADVLVLANGWCDGLEEYVYFYGEKHDLVEDDIIGNEIKHYRVDGFGDAISIRFYDGRPGQGPDTKLVSDTADLGQNWKSTSVVAGHAYVVIEREWSADLFDKGEPQFEFILRGIRLYDPRKDSTVVGGEGPHRLNDSSTWEHSLNPAVQRYNYQIGFRGLISNRVIIGEGKSSGQLDLGSYVAAMNVCDTIRGGKPTYQCSLWVTGNDDHTEVLKEFDDAMAGYGMNRRGLSGIIAGAPQIPVLEIDEDDVDAGRAKNVQWRKSSYQLYNHLSGQFTSPEAHWNAESLKPIKVNADVAADGRERQIANDFLQVTDPDIAQYLLQIRYRQNRRGGSATVPVSRRVGFKTLEGQWVTYLGKEWLITGHQCDAKLNFTLTLAETGADVYSSDDIVPGPIIVPPTPPINPSLGSTVQGFDVEVGTIDGEDGNQVPALRFSWTPPNDPTIKTVRFEYFVGNTPIGDAYRDSTDDVEAGEYVTTKNVIGGVFYTARATITTFPDRFKTWTAYATTVLPTANLTVPVDLSAEILAKLRKVDELAGAFRLFRRQFEDLAGASLTDQALLEDYRGQLTKGIAARYQENFAATELAMQSIATVNSALAQIFLGAIATTGAGTAESLLRFTALSDLEEGLLSLIQLQTRAEIGEAWAEAALELGVVSTPQGLKSIAILSGDQVFLKVGESSIPAYGLQRGDEARATPLVYSPSEDLYTITVDLTQKHKTYTALLDHDADIRFPRGAWVGAEFTLIVEQESPGGNELTYDTGVFIVGDELQQPSASPGVYSVYKCTVISLSPPVASLKLENFGATSSSSEAVFSIDPPIDGKSVWNLLTDGPLEIDGPVVGSADAAYTIIPLGIRLDARFELTGPGGTSGSVYDTLPDVQHPAQPADATFHTITAGAGKSSLSQATTSNGVLSSLPGDGGIATGGDTNENGQAGTNDTGSSPYVKLGRGGSSPDGGAEVPEDLYAVGGGNFGGKQATAGNSPGGGAGGAAYYYAPTSYFTSSGGAGGGAKVTKDFDEFDTLLQDTEYELILPAPKPAKISTAYVTAGTSPTGAHGGRSKIRITALI